MNRGVEPVLAGQEALPGPSLMPASDRRLAELEQRYPQAAATLLALPDGGTAFAHMASLDRRWAQALQQPAVPGVVVALDQLPPAREQFDIIVAGGGISLFSATLLAQAGYRVLVFDARRVGAAHRMWNISEPELAALVRLGFCSWAELEGAILKRYQRSLVRVHPTLARPGRELRLDGVLDLALDAELLLRLARRRLIEAGGEVLDGRSFRRVALAQRGPAGVVVDLETGDERCERYGARLLINAMGALSPLTLALHGGLPFSGVCPTVGSVARGFRQGQGLHEVDPSCGEVLVSAEGGRNGQQLLWEGFPGRGDELTVYLFYYDAVRRGQAPQSLLALYEQYVALLPSYKAAGPDFEHLRPLYGFIPSHYRHPAAQAGVMRGILSIGDAAAQHSALTFCGFGSHIRNLERICELTDYALRHDLLEARQLAQIGAAQPNLALHGLFSRFMRPWQGTDDVNLMLGAVCTALESLDPPTVRRFFQDRSSVGDYQRIMRALRRTAPWVVLLAARVLGWREALHSLRDLVGYTCGALLRGVLHTLDGPSAARLVRLIECLPEQGLRLRAQRATRRAMSED